MADVPLRAPSHADGIPESIGEIKTGPALTPEARKEARRNKTPSERVERLEQRADATDLVLTKVSTQMDGQDKVLGLIQGSLTQLSQRELVTFTAKVDVEKAKTIDQIEAGATAREDAADAKKTRRKLTTGIVLAIAGGAGGVVELLHQFGVLR